MAGKQAKILAVDAFDSLLAYASSSRHPVRNTVIVLLSVKAGLRAGEIANLTWPMVLTPAGEINTIIELRDQAAKMGSGRIVPLHPDLRDALIAHQKEAGNADLAVIRSERGGAMTPLSVVVWF